MATKKTFNFHFTTLAQDSGHKLTNVLFVDDAPTDIDALEIEAVTVDDIAISLEVADDEEVSEKNHHFKLTFDPGALARPEAIALDASHGGEWALLCVREAPGAASAEGKLAPGDVDLYVLYKGKTPLEVKEGSPLRLKLTKVGASSAGGTRPTDVSFTWNEDETDINKLVVMRGGPGGDYQLTEIVRLSLLAPLVQAAPTLMAGFISSDIILNDGAAENGLVLRVVNTGLRPIPLSPEGSATPSRISLRFEASEDAALLWALGTAAQIGQILIPAKEVEGSWVSDPAWSGKDTWTVTHTGGEATWTLTPKAGKTALEPGEGLEVPIGKVVTGHATGRSALRIGYGGLPGFGDGELVAFIQKYPLVFAGQKVGAGTRSPSEKLTVHTKADDGITHTDGSTYLRTRVEEFRGRLETNKDLQFSAASEGKMILTASGEVGIGTPSPSAKLTVHTEGDDGITHTNGTVDLATRVTASVGRLGTLKKHDLKLFTNGADQVTLTKDGKVGVGTGDPSAKLTVHTEGDDGITHTNGAVDLATRVTGSAGRLGTLKEHDLKLFTNGDDRVTLTKDGKVGIGTPSPSVALTVDAHKHGIMHRHEDTELCTYVDSRGGWLGTKSSHDLHFFTENSLPQMTLATDGKLGIGTMEPKGTLDVNGDFKIKGKRPIEYRIYTWDGESSSIPTGYSEQFWIAVVAGVESSGNNDTGELEGFIMFPIVQDGKWSIRIELMDINDSSWRLRVLFIRRELVEVIDW